MRSPNPDDICALCDECSVERVAPEKAAAGMGLCSIAEQDKPLRHVEWSGRTCVSFRLDRPNLRTRRQYVALQRRANASTEEPEII